MGQAMAIRCGRHRVVLNGEYSSWSDLLSGVPRASVLGTILFLIFIHDIDGVVREIKILKKISDDIKMGKTVATLEQREKMQQAIDNLMAWADKWGNGIQCCKM